MVVKYAIIGISIVLTIVLIFFITYFSSSYSKYTKFKYENIFNFPDVKPPSRKIPKIIIQTYHDKSKVPDKVYQNIKRYAPGYKHIVYDDYDCIKFLEKFDNKFTKNTKFNLVDRFKSYKRGAHKADLFRYCFLYVNGGIYLDIKTELIKPIDEIFTEDDTLYTVIALNKNSIYQGVIGTYPQNPIFENLINQCISCEHYVLNARYDLFLEFFYDQLLTKTFRSILKVGKRIGLYKIHLFVEDKGHVEDCDNKLDRYGICTFIHDEYGNKIIKTRYSDFPW